MIFLYSAFMVIFIKEIFAHRWVEVKIPQGFIRGLSLKSSNNNEMLAFLGIPYATPPVDYLRFKPSIPHPGWSNTLDATMFRSSCPQNDFKGNQLGDENCLFLNVFTPKINSKETLLPVMVYIQGESFENGDSSLYGPERLIDKGVVVVTFNYRLGILGFLSTGDEVASGNWGLHDQKLALQWVRMNIGIFSGDPNLVTIFGQGAGAASVIYHIVSPLSQGLFHRAIAQSGSALCEWSIERHPVHYTRDIGLRLGCPRERNIDLVECLRGIPFNKLLKVQSTGKIFGEFPQRAAPVIDKSGTDKFIPDDPKILLQKGYFNKIPLLMGINKNEAAYFYPLLLSNAQEMRESPHFFKDIFLTKFLDAATQFRDHPKQNEIKNAILFRYFNNFNYLNITDISLRFINMSTDAIYLSCVDETLKTYSQFNDFTFMYLFSYKGSNTLVNLLVRNEPTLFDTGVCHGDELFYLFDLKIEGKKYFSPYDQIIADRLLTLWTDFAKYGYAPHKVNYEYPRWPRWQEFNGQSTNYYNIGNELRPSFSYRQSETYFWSHQLIKLFGYGPFVQSLSRVNSPMYKTLAWTMVAVSLSLLVLIIVLLAILYYQRKSQSFRAQPTETSSRISGGSSALY